MEKVITASVPAHLQKHLHAGKDGEIILVSSSGIYLRFCEQIVLVCDQDWGVLPIGIGVEDFGRTVRLLRPQQGQRVRISENCLRFRSGSIRLVPENRFRGGACHSLPQVSSIRQAAEELAALRKERGLSMLVLPLVLGRTAETFWEQNPYCARGCQYLSKLMTALDGGDSCDIYSCVEKFLGLGPGLTPSADDVLLGMLYVFGALPRKAPGGTQAFRECVRQLCDRCTGQISAAYLKAMIEGAPFERMEQVFRGLCGEETPDIGKLTQIGSSSGSEMLLGMLIALKICGYDVSQKEELQ